MKHTFKTRLSKDTEPVSTVAEINWDGVTQEQIVELASRSVIIDQQKMYRDAGHVPAEDTIAVADILAGKRAPKDPMVAATKAIGKLSKEEREALLLKLMA